jgi:diguanylate cyclase (GGDEF)-like protein
MDWSFDIRSALLVGALLTTAVGGLMLLVARGFAPSYRASLGWWVAGTLMLPASFVVLAAREVLPAIVGIVVSNALVAGGIAAYAIALEIFHSLPRRRVRLWLLVLATVLGSVWLAQVVAEPALRISAVILGLVSLLGCMGWNLYAPRSRGRTRHILGAVIALSIAILLHRGATMFLEPGAYVDTFRPGSMQVLSFAVGSVLPVIASFAFLLMCTERSQRELERAARVDFLTECYNRRAIEELGARAIAGARRHGMPLAVLVLDIDHFKRINDELGHAAGDDALTEAVVRIRATLRSEDMLGRMGGEEFIVLMPNTDSTAAVVAGERIRQGFSCRPLRLENEERRVTLSVGAAVLAPADRQFSQLLQRADRAMYAAKNAGRDLVISDAMSGWDGSSGQPG